MARKKRPYQLPPKVAHAQQLAARVAEYKPRPDPPTLRLILGLFGLWALCLGMALLFWFSPRPLVHDLRDRGITVAAEVTAVDNKPKYVQVRFVHGPDRGTTVKLSEYAGMLPETRTGDSLLVTYDRKNPSRSLAAAWVTHPPPNWPAYGTSALAVLTFGLTTAVVLRRRWILRTPWPPDPFAPEEPGASPPVRLTKP